MEPSEHSRTARHFGHTDAAVAHRAARMDLRNAYAPGGAGPLAVCPHCWEVNVRAFRLCGRCGADMHLALQESGGLRLTAPVQSPVPVRVGARLSPLQRALVLCFVALLVIAQIVGALYASTRRSVSVPAGFPPPQPASSPGSD
jgi:hypothetical protein